jgi:HD-like signal output (HDOD) protein
MVGKLNSTQPHEPDRAEILSAASALGVLGASRGSIALILSTLCNPQSSAEDVAQVISREPGLTARVLRVANSAYYGASGSVATLTKAFVLLGVNAVRGIAAAATLDRATARAFKGSPIDLAQVLRHSIATASAAEALARASGRKLSSEAFIAGLLHDFGVMLQLHIDRVKLVGVMEAVGRDPRHDVRAAEARLQLVSHEECAAIVFAEWKLPKLLIEAVRHHHAPAGAPESSRGLATLVHLADRMAVTTGHAYVLEAEVENSVEDTLGAVGLAPVDLEQVLARLPERVQELQGLLGPD